VPSSVVWAAVVPVKGGPLAKSRLALPRGSRAALATAFARDTVAALRAADPRMPVLVVTGAADVAAWARPDGAEVVDDPGGGLDAAVAAGVAAAVGRATHAAVVLGDHPALRPEEVRAALAEVGATDRVVVPDAEGSGTALLTLPAGPGARTAFGHDSAAAHERLGHTRRTPPVPGLRQDVDDGAGLAAAVRLGVGPHTAAALARATLPGVQATIHRSPDGAEPGAALLDDGVEVVVPPQAVEGSGLRHLRVGQRVTVELDDDGRSATRVWVVGIGPGETIG
jgi:2-phospho-L-lactate/phosphoenolpyruvate guanylyltransferase